MNFFIARRVLIVPTMENSIRTDQSMFKSAFDDYKAKRAEKRQSLSAVETKIIEQSLPAVNDALFTSVNPATEILSLQTQIEEKSQEVRDSWHDYQRQLERWVTLVTNLEVAVADVGDLQEWAHSVQADIETVFRAFADKKETA
jgi:hypothetical protein